MGRDFHIHMSIRGALRNREFSCFQHSDGRPMTPDEAFNNLCDLLARGVELVPATGCDNFDPKEGCRGHEVIETETV